MVERGNKDTAEQRYSKCPKILYTKVPNKMIYANSADPDLTAPEGESDEGLQYLLTILLSTVRNNCTKSKI